MFTQTWERNNLVILANPFLLSPFRLSSNLDFSNFTVKWVFTTLTETSSRVGGTDIYL